MKKIINQLGKQSNLLKSIIFTTINEDEEARGIIVDDSYKVLVKTENEIKLEYIRHICFEPKTIFDLAITYEVIKKLDDEYVGKVKVNEKLDDDTIEKNINEILSNVKSESSLLVAQITAAYSSPLIVAPMFEKRTLKG